MRSSLATRNKSSLEASSAPVPHAQARASRQQEIPVLNLQHFIGNQAVLRLMRAKTVDAASGAGVEETKLADRLLSPLRPPAIVQPKLEINAPGDVHEREADRVADQVMREPQREMSTAMLSGAYEPVQRNCECGGSCAKCQDEHPGEPRVLQTKAVSAANAVPAMAPPTVHQVLNSPGQPLDAETRAFMQPMFGRDFSNVRVHTDAQAIDSAQALQALAYTVGRHIVFGAGQFALATQTGQRLLAHELTHVVQQEPVDASPPSCRARSKEASYSAVMPAVSTQKAVHISRTSALQLSRQPKPGLLTMPFQYRFWNAWHKAKEASLKKVYELDKKYHDSSIRRGLIEITDLVPSPEEVWKAGIADGLFSEGEKKVVTEWSEEQASQSFEKRYKAAKYGRIYGEDENYYKAYGSYPRDDKSIWERGQEYHLFLPSEKAAVLRIPPAGIAAASTLTTMINAVRPNTPEARRAIDLIHDFARNPAVVLLGPEVGKLLGPYGYTYRESADAPDVGHRIDEAYEKYVKSLGPRRVRASESATTKEKWDECMRRRNLGENNLEAAEFDEVCFESEHEFYQEKIRRITEFRERLKHCGHSGPKNYECQDRVFAEYFPMKAAQRDAILRWTKAEMDLYEGVVAGGVIAQTGFYVGHDILGWSSERSAALGGALSTAAGVTGVSIVRGRLAAPSPVPSSGGAPQPRTPIGEIVEKPEPMPTPGEPAPVRPATTTVNPEPKAVTPPKPPVTAPVKPPSTQAPVTSTKPAVEPAKPPATRPPVRRIVAVPPPAPLIPEPRGNQRRYGPRTPTEDQLHELANQDIIVGMHAEVEVTGAPAEEGLRGADFAQLDKTRAAAVGGEGKAAVLPQVKQPSKTSAKAGTHQPSSGLVVKPPPRSRRLEIFAWNTGAPVRLSNASHAERQFINWLENQDPKWIARVKSIDVSVFGRDICEGCAAYIHDLHRNPHYAHIKFTWKRGDTGSPLPRTPR
jgi:hypothetical protein